MKHYICILLLVVLSTSCSFSRTQTGWMFGVDPEQIDATNKTIVDSTERLAKLRNDRTELMAKLSMAKDEARMQRIERLLDRVTRQIDAEELVLDHAIPAQTEQLETIKDNL